MLAVERPCPGSLSIGACQRPRAETSYHHGFGGCLSTVLPLCAGLPSILVEASLSQSDIWQAFETSRRQMRLPRRRIKEGDHLQLLMEAPGFLRELAYPQLPSLSAKPPQRALRGGLYTHGLHKTSLRNK